MVVVNVQRSGPSTGMPTKSEQGDLLQALYGRNGEAPMLIIAASSPVDCFYAAFETARFAMEHMTPAILLTDGYIGFGSELFLIPKMDDLPAIVPPIAAPNSDYKPYRRDENTLARQWAIPGTEGLRHRIGGLEKTDVFGQVSTDAANHEKMTYLRNEKVMRIADQNRRSSANLKAIFWLLAGVVLVVLLGLLLKNFRKRAKKSAMLISDTSCLFQRIPVRYSLLIKRWL